MDTITPDLLEKVGAKCGWTAEDNNDISLTLGNLSLRVKHGSKKKDKIVQKAPAKGKSSKKKIAIESVSSDEDFYLDKPQSSKKKPKTSFPFTSSEDSVFSHKVPVSVKKKVNTQKENVENIPPHEEQSRKKVPKKKAKKMLVSFSSEEDLSPAVTPKRGGTNIQHMDSPKSSKRANRMIPATVTDATKDRNSPRPAKKILGTPTTAKTLQVDDNSKGARNSSIVTTGKAATPKQHAVKDKFVSKPTPVKSQSSSSKEEGSSSSVFPRSSSSISRTSNSDQQQSNSRQSRISIGQAGYETIIQSPRQIRMSRLSTNSNISCLDPPIAESTCLDLEEDSPLDSYLSRPVFQQQKGPSCGVKLGNDKSSKCYKGLKEELSQELDLHLTLTQAPSQQARGDSEKSSDVRTTDSSELRGRVKLTQIAPGDRLRDEEESSEDEAFKTVISETNSESNNSRTGVYNMDEVGVIEESCVSMRHPTDSSASLFSTKLQESDGLRIDRSLSSDKSTDQSLSSIVSQNLSSFIKGKRPKKGKKKSSKKSAKFQLVACDLSSDEDLPKVKKDEFTALLDESKLILKSIQENESVDIPQTQNHHYFVPDTQASDVLPDSHDVYDVVRVSETDSNSLNLVPDSEHCFVPDSQHSSVHIVKDSQETVDTTMKLQCIPDSEGYTQSQPTQDTVIHAGERYSDSSSRYDNATVMFIKSKTKYVGKDDEKKSLIQQSIAEDGRHNDTDCVEGSQSGLDIVDPKDSSKIPMELIQSLEDPDDIRATIELLSQRLENILSSKQTADSSNINTSQNRLSLENTALTNDRSRDSFNLPVIITTEHSKNTTPRSIEQSFNDLCIKEGSEANSNLKETTDIQVRNISLQASMLPDGSLDLDLTTSEEEDADVSVCNVSLQCSLKSPEIESDLSDNDKDCNNEEERKEGASNNPMDVIMECEELKDAALSEDELINSGDEYEQEDNILYRTAIGEDLDTMIDNEDLTDDESFDARKNDDFTEDESFDTKKPNGDKKENAEHRSPESSFMFENVRSMERVKDILAAGKFRRRSSVHFTALKVLSLTSTDESRISEQGLNTDAKRTERKNSEGQRNTGEDIVDEFSPENINDNSSRHDVADEEENSDPDCLPDINSPNQDRERLGTWRTAPESCPSPEGIFSSEDNLHIPSASDSEDDRLDNFFSKMKTPAQRPTSAQSLDNFIVDDDDFTSDEDELFHQRIDNTVNDKEKERPLFKTPSLPSIKRKQNFRNNSTIPESSSSSDLRRGLSSPTTPNHPVPSRQPNTTGHAPVHASFLCSLSACMDGKRRHPDAIKYVKEFARNREELTDRLFRLYNETVFNHQLPISMDVKWNSRLLKTAGFCAYKKDPSSAIGRVVRIELSVKVCDTSERVRDTLIHELCHAAVWVVHGVNDGHGPYWKHWANKANRIHPDLPVIKRCHNYDIQTKYTYKCTSCGYEVGRHSKSLNTETKVCGYCRSPFQLLINTKSGQKTPRTPATPRTPNRFAMFVKENYKTIKEKHKAGNHKEVMALLSEEFAKTKV